MEAIPDVPEEIDIQLERTEFITRKLIDKVADDDATDTQGSDEPLDIKDYPDFGGVYKNEIAAVSAADSVQLYKWRSL